MLRPFYALLILIGLIVGVFSTFRALEHTGTAPRPVEIAPVTTTRSLTAGVWSVYGQAGTGPFGTPLPVAVTVTAPGGVILPLISPSGIVTLRADGRTFAEAASVRIATPGSYDIQITPQGGTSLRVLLTRVLHSRFPWNALAVDGLVVLAVGSALFAFEARRRRQLEALELALQN
jgi:hypothetical protein